MTLFKDVISPLTNGLDNLDKMTKKTVDRYNSDTTQVQRYVTSNITGQPGSIFLGQGANACIAAINRNTSRAQHGTTKLGDFQLACSQTKKNLDDLCASFDKQSIYYLTESDYVKAGVIGPTDSSIYHKPSVWNYFLGTWDYSYVRGMDPSQPIVDTIRESTLPFATIDGLLKVGAGQGFLEDSINIAVSSIQRSFGDQQSRLHEQLEAEYRNVSKDDSYYTWKKGIDTAHDQAIKCMNLIASKMKTGYTEWAMEFQATVGQFQGDVDAASDMQKLTVGDITNEINSGPYKNAKVIIQQTPNGLVVTVKGNVDPATVEQDIQKYLQEHGLPSNEPITMFGYENGGAAAQQVILDGGYNVTNLVLVGAPMNDKLLGSDINILTYQQAPSETKDQEATILGLKPDQLLIPLATSVVLLFLTGGTGDLAELGALAGEKAVDVGAELAATEAWNAAASQWNSANPDQQIPVPTANSSYGPQLYVDTGDGTGAHHITPNEMAQLLADSRDPQNPHLPPGWKFYEHNTGYVPDESGEDPSKFTNSSYLNSQTIP